MKWVYLLTHALVAFAIFSPSVISTSHQRATFLDMVRGTIAVEIEFDEGIWAVSIEAGGRETARTSKVVMLSGLPWWVSERR